MAKHGDLRVWWIPQVPMKQFFVDVSSLREAGLVLDTLAAYDEFQLRHRIKPDYCNAGGVDVYDLVTDDGWTSWYDDETGDDFDTWWSAQKAGVGDEL